MARSAGSDRGLGRAAARCDGLDQSEWHRSPAATVNSPTVLKFSPVLNVDRRRQQTMSGPDNSAGSVRSGRRLTQGTMLA